MATMQQTQHGHVRVRRESSRASTPAALPRTHTLTSKNEKPRAIRKKKAWGKSRSIRRGRAIPRPFSRAQGVGGPPSGLARLRVRRLPPPRLLLGWVSSARRDAGVSECTSVSSVLSAARATLAEKEPRSRSSKARTPSSSARCWVAMLLCAETMLPSARHAW